MDELTMPTGRRAKPDSDIADDMEAFRIAQESERDNRDLALQDLRFARLGEQWPSEIKSIREVERRPCLTVNRLPAYGRHVVNEGRKNRPQITVQAVDGKADPITAKIIQGIIYHCAQISDADVAWDTAYDYAVSCGFGYARIDVDYATDDTFDTDILIKSVRNPFSIYGDPDSMDATSADWNSAFVLDTISRKEFKSRWPDAEPVTFSSDNLDGFDEAGRREERIGKESIVVAEHWVRERAMKPVVLLSDGSVISADVYSSNRDTFDMAGLVVQGARDVRSYKVSQRILSGRELLETNPWAGKYIPIVAMYGEDIIVDGVRYLRGLFRDVLDVQRMFNYWRSASAELIALSPKAPFIGPVGAFNTDADKWVSANVRSHAYIEYDGPTAPVRQGFAGPPAGILQEALNAADDMKAIMGIYDASMGARSNEISGLAIKQRAKQADVGSYHFIDNHNRSIAHAGRIIIDLIPHVYAARQVVRTLQGPGNDQAEMVELGKPVQLPDGTLHIYDIGVGKYDIVSKAGPSYSTKREESADQMMALINAYPQLAAIAGDLLISNFDWVGSEEIVNRIRQAMIESKTGSPEMQAMKAEMETQKARGLELIQELQTKLVKLEQDRALDARKLDIDAYEADTKRLTGLSKDNLLPEHLRYGLNMALAKTIAETIASADILPVEGGSAPPPGSGPQLIPRDPKPASPPQPPIPLPDVPPLPGAAQEPQLPPLPAPPQSPPLPPDIPQ